jgi:hypothetical protein
MEWKPIHWKEVLEVSARRHVVPIIGPDVLVVEYQDRRSVPFPMLLATRLAERLPSEQRRRLPAEPTLHEVAITPQWKGNESDFAAELAQVEEEALSEFLPRVLDGTRPTPLLQLAEITDFPLYLTTTPDTLFEHVLVEVRRLTMPDVHAFHLRKSGQARGDDTLDLPKGWEWPQRATIRAPTLFYLFGRLGTEANFDVTNEQRLETLWQLQNEDYQPEQLIRELRGAHILLLGTRLPDWIGRYSFLRLVRGQRLVEPGGSTQTLADIVVVNPGQSAQFVAFLEIFSQKTRIYRGGGPGEFINELHDRWRKVPNPKPIEPPPVSDIAPPRDLKGDGCFISYLRADASAATALYKALGEAGIPAWLDLAEMRGGDRVDDKILPNVKNAAFFLPLLSANVQEVGGYYRKEWSWALKRNEEFTGISDRGYLRPIIVDSTPKTDFKDIPREFTDVHIEVWPQGEPTPKFLSHISAAHQRWAKPSSAT